MSHKIVLYCRQNMTGCMGKGNNVGICYTKKSVYIKRKQSEMEKCSAHG